MLGAVVQPSRSLLMVALSRVHLQVRTVLTITVVVTPSRKSQEPMVSKSGSRPGTFNTKASDPRSTPAQPLCMCGWVRQGPTTSDSFDGDESINSISDVNLLSLCKVCPDLPHLLPGRIDFLSSKSLQRLCTPIDFLIPK